MSRPPPTQRASAEDSTSSSHALMQAQSLLDELTATGSRLAHLPARAFALACFIAGLMALSLGVHHYLQVPHPLTRQPDLIDAVATAGALMMAWGAFAAWRGRVDMLARQLLSLCAIAFYAFALLMADPNTALFLGGLAVFLHLVLPRGQALAGVAALALTTLAVPWAGGQPLRWSTLWPVLATAGLITVMLQSISAQADQVRRAIGRSTRRLQALTQAMVGDIDRAQLARLRAENALASQRATQARADELGLLLESTIDNLSQGLIVVGPDQRVRLFNEQASQLLGLPRSMLEARPAFEDLVRFQRDRGDFGPALERLDEAVRPLVRELSGELSTKLPPRYTREMEDGRRLEIDNRIMPSGHVVHTYTDVTDYVRANEQLQSSLAQLRQAEQRLQTELQRTRQDVDMNTRFVAAVSHEIRTSLNGITGMSDLLVHSSLSGEQMSMVRDMRSSAKQLRRLTDDILDLARLQDTQFRLEQLPFSLHRQLTLCVQGAQGSAQRKGLALALDLACPDLALLGDPQRVTQVLNNLIYNAIKFTERGSIRVAARVNEPGDPSEPVDVFLTVADTGRGIAPSMLESIFEPFHQGPVSTNRDFGGTGLGLALCRQLCEAMGGQITVTSRVGTGSVFNVHLPLPRSSTDVPWSDTVPGDAGLDTSGLRGRRVLVVDDNRINRRLVCAWLDAVGAGTATAGDGAEGVRLATSQDFDCVLMDMSMPVMNGLDAARRIRSLADRPDAVLGRRGRVPIIGVTAMARPEDLQMCLDAGMDAHVSKPLERQVLLRVILQSVEASAWLESSRSGWLPLQTIAEGTRQGR